MEKTCNSCKRKTTNDKSTVEFGCPKCKETITRCGNCKSIAAKYTCTCGFEGPN